MTRPSNVYWITIYTGVNNLSKIKLYAWNFTDFNNFANIKVYNMFKSEYTNVYIYI